MLLNRSSVNVPPIRQHKSLSQINPVTDSCSYNKARSISETYNIVHISDLHLSRKYYREHIKSLKILLRSALDSGVDHFVITGDIVSTADPDDFYLAREIFSNMGLLSSERLTVVPGNHDVFGGPHRAIDILSFPKHIRNIDYHNHMMVFYETFSETFSGVRLLSDNSPFPFVKKIGPVTLIGLNSVPHWSLWQNPLGSNGIINDDQFSSLERLAETDPPMGQVVVAMHHHFNDIADNITANKLWRKIETKTMRMRKRRKTTKLFNKLNVSHVLHGHIHLNEIYEQNDIQFVNGAGSVCDDPIPILKYNVIKSQGNQIKANICYLPYPYQASSVDMAIKRPIKKLTFAELSNQPA